MAGKETVAVLGAGGTMGLPMARNIAKAGIQVRAWNRSADKAAPLAAEGVYLADSPADAARDAGIVLTMVMDADAVMAVMDGPDGALSAMTGTSDLGGDQQHGHGIDLVGDGVGGLHDDVRYRPDLQRVAGRLHVEGAGERRQHDLRARHDHSVRCVEGPDGHVERHLGDRQRHAEG